MHYYKFEIGYYRRQTAHLSLLEHGVYRTALDTYYLSEKPLPKETKAVYRALSARSEIEQEAVDHVLADFFVLEEDGYHHSHCDEVIDGYQANALIYKENGKKGGRPKKNQNKTKAVSEDNQTESESKDNSLTQELNNSETQVEKKKPSPAKKGSRLDSSWTPPREWTDWAIQQGMTGQQALNEAAKFRDYWIAVPGQKGVKLDWGATWRNWIRKSIEWAAKRGGSPKDEQGFVERHQDKTWADGL